MVSSPPGKAVDLAEVLSAWGIRPDAVHAPPPGTNNLTRLIEAGGSRLVLRISRTLSARKAEAEAVLRERLHAARPGFSVPVPIRTLDGGYVSDHPAGAATVSAFLPGARPDLGTPAAFTALGHTAGRLVAALALLPDHLLVHDWTAGPLTLLAGGSAGDLAGDLRRAGAPATAVAALLRGVTDLVTGYATLTAGLPVQLVHGDLAAGNVLADGDLAAGARITGVLDFEVAGLDLRVNDLVTAMAQTTALDSPASTRALAEGFEAQVRLTGPERDAVPDLLVARAVGTVLWRAAAWRRGDVGLDQVAERLARLTTTLTFVKEHRADLQQALTAPAGGPPVSPARG